jgi:hypothetical protein
MSKEVSKVPAVRVGHVAVAKAIIEGTQGRAISPWYRNMSYREDTDSRGRNMVHVGTPSSFAHWEEWGMINWQGPIGPMRRAIFGIGLGGNIRFLGPNSQRHPI